MSENDHIHCALSAILLTFTLIYRSPSNYLKFIRKKKCSKNAHVSCGPWCGPVFSRLKGSITSSQPPRLGVPVRHAKGRCASEVCKVLDYLDTPLDTVTRLFNHWSIFGRMPCPPACPPLSLCSRRHIRMDPYMGDRATAMPSPLVCALRPRARAGMDRFG